MSQSINKSVVLFITSLSQNLVGLLLLACAFNKFELFESAHQSRYRSQSVIYRPRVAILNIINVMPVKPMAINMGLMGKWHRLTSRPVGKVNM